MEQNNHKFRLRLNLFDAIVLVVVLLAAAVFGYLTLRDKGTDASAPTTQTVQYTVLFQKMNESGSQMVKAGGPAGGHREELPPGHRGIGGAQARHGPGAGSGDQDLCDG